MKMMTTKHCNNKDNYDTVLNQTVNVKGKQLRQQTVNLSNLQ